MPQVTIEVADRTLVDLSNQSELSVEKHSEGSFKVSESLIPVMAEVYDKNAESPQLIEVAQDQMLRDVKAERSMASIDEAVEVPPANEEIKAPVVEAQPIAPIGANIQSSVSEKKIETSPTNPQQPQKPDDSSFKRHTKLVLSPTLSYSRIDAKDTSAGGEAIIGSDLNFGLLASWYQEWAEKFRSFVWFYLNYVSILPAEGSRSIANRRATYSGLGVGIEKNLSPNLTLGASVGSRQQIYVRSVSNTEISLDKVNVPEFEGYGRYTLITSPSPLHVGLEGRVKWLFPQKYSGYQTQMGQSYTGKLLFEQELRDLVVGVDVFYSRQFYNASLVTQSRSDAGFMFRIGWEIGK